MAQLAKDQNASLASPLAEKVDEELVKTLACTAAGSLCPMQAVIGGIAAQEIMKVSEGAPFLSCMRALHRVTSLAALPWLQKGPRRWFA